MKNLFLGELNEHLNVMAGIKQLEECVIHASNIIAAAMNDGGKMMLCGNGGSAADSQHIAAEFSGRFRLDRKPLPAISLTTDSSALTSISNDYSFESVFSRQLEAIGKNGDILLVISTSGNSSNILRAVESANRKKVFSIGLLGNDGGKLKPKVDLPIIVGSPNTARIQEAHIFIGHMICALVESKIE
jgi:D-sedoheptulose 7-phosphate isomerase